MELNGLPIVERTVPVASGIYSFTAAPGMGGATLSLRARSPDGLEYDVFAAPDLKNLEQAFGMNPNAAFQAANVPLFPMANRLRPEKISELKLGDLFSTNVEGVPVTMPLNNQADDTGSIPHHLHGLAYARRADAVRAVMEHETSSEYVADFSNVGRGLWTGETRLEVRQSMEKGAFHYSLEGWNTGSTPVPVGFGSHPYFKLPSGDPSAIKLVIPAKRRAEIDNYANVLPTGRWLPLGGKSDPHDFNLSASGKIEGVYLDNYYPLEVFPDSAGERAIELRDSRAKRTYRLVAETSNIIGAQVYYPGKGDVIALELVTHHPDPRRELWNEPTGIEILQPGNSVRYAYRIEIRED